MSEKLSCHDHGNCELCDQIERELTQARADVGALRRVDETAEALILSIGYPKDRLLVARYTSAKAALPKHLKGASE